MSVVGTNASAMPPQSVAAVAARPKDDQNAPSEGAWQRALVSASHGSESSSVSTAIAGRLFDLNAVIAAPASELALGLPKPAPADWLSMPARDVATPRATVESHRGPTRSSTSHASALVNVREADAIAGGRASEPVAGGVASAAVITQGRTTLGERSDKAVSTSRDGAPTDTRPVGLAFASPLATQERALAAYAEAMSTNAAASDASNMFTLVPKSSVVPVRIYVQWRGRMADVWIGLHRRAFDQLPDIRAGIQDWVSSRGGVVGRLVCNGERLEGTPIPSSFPGVL